MTMLRVSSVLVPLGLLAGSVSQAEASDQVPPAPAPAPPPAPASPPGAAPVGASAPLDAATPDTVAVEAEAEEPLPLAGYEKGFFIRDPDDLFLLRIGARVQARFTYEALDQQETDEINISIPRARVALSGHALTKNLGYKFQADFGKGSVALKDFYLDYGIVPKALHVRAGQFKRPFSRQQLNSSGRLELVDRAITDKAFGAGRDIGLMFHDRPTKSPTFEYALGVFNGSGDKGGLGGDVVVDPETGEGEIESGKFNNVPDRLHPMLVARVGYNYGKKPKMYREADLEGGPFRFGIGASGIVDWDVDNDDDGNLRGEVDYMVKLHGFSTTGALYVASAQDGDGFGDQAYDAYGFHFQAGYVIEEMFQPAFRYASVRPDEGGDQQEIGGGLSLYLIGHKLKVQTDGFAMVTAVEGGDRLDGLFRTQVQGAF